MTVERKEASQGPREDLPKNHALPFRISANSFFTKKKWKADVKLKIAITLFLTAHSMTYSTVLYACDYACL